MPITLVLSVENELAPFGLCTRIILIAPFSSMSIVHLEYHVLPQDNLCKLFGQ